MMVSPPKPWESTSLDTSSLKLSNPTHPHSTISTDTTSATTSSVSPNTTTTTSSTSSPLSPSPPPPPPPPLPFPSSSSTMTSTHFNPTGYSSFPSSSASPYYASSPSPYTPSPFYSNPLNSYSSYSRYPTTASTMTSTGSSFYTPYGSSSPYNYYASSNPTTSMSPFSTTHPYSYTDPFQQHQQHQQQPSSASFPPTWQKSTQTLLDILQSFIQSFGSFAHFLDTLLHTSFQSFHALVHFNHQLSFAKQYLSHLIQRIFQFEPLSSSTSTQTTTTTTPTRTQSSALKVKRILVWLMSLFGLLSQTKHTPFSNSKPLPSSSSSSSSHPLVQEFLGTSTTPPSSLHSPFSHHSNSILTHPTFLQRYPWFIKVGLIVGLPWLLSKCIPWISSSFASTLFSNPLTHANSLTSSSPPTITSSTSSFTSPSSSSSSSMGMKPMDFAQALYDYTPTSPNELSFKKGDWIFILEKPYLTHPHPEIRLWWRGKVQGQPKIGFVPANYLEVIEKGKSK